MQPRPEDQKIAEQLVQRLIAEFQPKRIVWFGSRARGEGGPDSDWDVMVVAESGDPLSERLYRAQRATGDIHVAKDIVVCTTAEYQRLRSWMSSVVAEAERTGNVMYEAA